MPKGFRKDGTPLGRPKKIITHNINTNMENETTETIPEVVEAPVKNTEVISETIPKTISPFKESLTKLLRAKMHSCYDAEPRGSLTAHLDVMVDEIINLFNS